MIPIEDKRKCIICFEALDQNNKLTIGCGHAFHKSCVDQWSVKKHQNNTIICPVCTVPDNFIENI